MITIVITATLASIGTAGVPGSGMVMLAMVLQSVGLPVEGIALVAGIDRIFDMGRTTVNITGDASCTVIVSHLLRNKIASWSKRQETAVAETGEELDAVANEKASSMEEALGDEKGVSAANLVSRTGSENEDTEGEKK